MGFLNGGDVEVRVSRRALVLAAVALASATAFAIGLRWAVAPAAEPAPARPADAPPAAIAAAAAPPAPAAMPAPAGGSPAGLPGLEVMVARLEAKLANGGGTADQWQLLGQTYRELGRDADALAAFERATALDPANPAVRADLEAARSRAAGKTGPR